jgi:hypothetical protein
VKQRFSLIRRKTLEQGLAQGIELSKKWLLLRQQFV